MNAGAFGENFPYSNFHDLNMDWIIRIAKDFLDQYTHIQEIIANGEESLQNLTTSGLEQLQEKADALEALLQAWYDTHSEDIANRLADALNDLNKWYTEHSEDISNQLSTALLSFENSATQYGEHIIQQIPEDYTDLSNAITSLQLYDQWEQVDMGTVHTGTFLSTELVDKVLKLKATSSTEDYGYYVKDVVSGDRYAIFAYTYFAQPAYIITDTNNVVHACAEDRSYNGYYPEYTIITIPEGASRLYLPFCNIARTVYNTDVSIPNNNTHKVTKFKKYEIFSPHCAPCYKQEGYYTMNNSDTTDTLIVYPGSGFNVVGYKVYAGDTIYVKAKNSYARPAYILTNNSFKVIGISTTSYTDPPAYAEYTLNIVADGYLWTNETDSYETFVFRLNASNETENKKWTVIGDSITDVDTLGSNVPIYPDYVKKKLNLIVSNKGSAGTGFWNGGSYTQGTNTYYNRALTIDQDSDIITVMGSFNDLYADAQQGIIPVFGTAEDTGTNTLGGCMVNTIINLRTRCPYAKILYISPLTWMHWNNVVEVQSWEEGWAEHYVTLMKDVCEKYNIPFLDLYHYSGFTPWIQTFREEFVPDGTHPNSNGHKTFIAPLVKSKIESLM